MGTYLEDYLESMYMLPSEIKRNFDLMRELDKVRALRLLAVSSLSLCKTRCLNAFFPICPTHDHLSMSDVVPAAG